MSVIGRFRPWPSGQHPDEAYLADALESWGTRVVRVDQEVPSGPDPSTTWAIFTNYSKSMARMQTWRGSHRTILWTLDLVHAFPDRMPIVEAAKGANLFVSSDQFDWYGKFGIGHHLYLAAACEGDVPIFSPKPRRACAFMGTLYSKRRREIAGIVMGLGGEVLSEIGKWIYRSDLAKYVQETKVIVGDNAVNDVPGYWSSRNYVIPGAGGFLLTQSVPGLELDFEFGKHIATYQSLNELPSEISRWVANDEAREKIRRAGFIHVRKHHTWRERARELQAKMAEMDAEKAEK